jgi:hypothetical protein
MAKAPTQYAVLWLKATIPVAGPDSTPLSDLDTMITTMVSDLRGVGDVEQAHLTVPSHTVDYTKG